VDLIYYEGGNLLMNQQLSLHIVAEGFHLKMYDVDLIHFILAETILVLYAESLSAIAVAFVQIFVLIVRLDKKPGLINKRLNKSPKKEFRRVGRPHAVKIAGCV
jgi:hypothetical protein